MKFRSLFLGVMAAAAVSAAEVTGDNTFGIIKLEGITTTNTMVAVPWVDCTDASKNVCISNLVMTIGLKKGDKLIINDDGTYKGWELDADDGKWGSFATVTINGKSVSPADAETLARGQGFFLVRGTGWDGKPFDLYLYGQVATNDMTAVTAAKGAYTLLSNPTAEPIGYSSIGTNNGVSPTKGDLIITMKSDGDSQLRAKYNGTKWRVQTVVESVVTWADADSNTIPAGGGFWYYNAGEGRSFKW